MASNVHSILELVEGVVVPISPFYYFIQPFQSTKSRHPLPRVDMKRLQISLRHGCSLVPMQYAGYGSGVTLFPAVTNIRYMSTHHLHFIVCTHTHTQSALISEPVVVFVCATTDQGDELDNMK